MLPTPSDRKLINRIITELAGDVDTITIHKLVQPLSVPQLEWLLRELSNVYYNTGKAMVKDETYDELRDLLHKLTAGKSEVLTEVGAPVIGNKKKVTLPYPMPSLEKKNTEKEITRWLKKWFPDGDNVNVELSDKLDGVSAQLYIEATGAKLFTRGEATIGTDISHLIPHVFDEKMLTQLEVGTSIRGELIIATADFKAIQETQQLKNARNAVAGVVNAKHPNTDVLAKLQFIAYSVLHPRLVQTQQYKLMKNYGLMVVPHKRVTMLSVDYLSRYLANRHLHSAYEIDGIVCVENTQVHKLKVDNPKFAFAFKVNNENDMTLATVIQIHWAASKDSYLKPRVEIEPVNLQGVQITYATAYNAQYVVDSNLGPGAVITIVRSGGVIPKIVEVIQPAAEPQMPEVPYHWNDSHVDIVCDDTDFSKETIVKRLHYFFETIGVKYLGIKTVEKFVAAGYDTVFRILRADPNDLTTIAGMGKKSIDKIFKDIYQCLHTVSMAELMCASNLFGRSLATKKFVKILEAYPDVLSGEWNHNVISSKINELDGFSHITTAMFVNYLNEFKQFLADLREIYPGINPSYPSPSAAVTTDEQQATPKTTPIGSGQLAGEHIVFTGFRDAKLKAEIQAMGGIVDDSITRKTTLVIYKESSKSSAKLQKAIKLELRIISREEFLKTL